jgi:uncharacterized membrane protein YeaQ/YmgE (transglycosylase-associated protein family)
MHYLWLALIGLAIGAFAKLLTPGRDPGGCIVTMIVGLVGAMLGGFLASAAGISATGDFAWFAVSVVGAMIVLVLYRLLFGKRKTL